LFSVLPAQGSVPLPDSGAASQSRPQQRRCGRLRLGAGGNADFGAKNVYISIGYRHCRTPDI